MIQINSTPNDQKSYNATGVFTIRSGIYLGQANCFLNIHVSRGHEIISRMHCIIYKHINYWQSQLPLKLKTGGGGVILTVCLLHKNCISVFQSC